MREGEEEARGSWVLWVWKGKGVWVGGDHVGEGDWAEAKLRERQGCCRAPASARWLGAAAARQGDGESRRAHQPSTGNRDDHAHNASEV